MEVKPGYKQTEVGVIPEEWSIRPLGLICDVRDGTHESPRFFKDGVPFVTSKNIVDGRLDLENVSFISQSDAVEFDKRSKVDRNDILLSMIGTIGSAVLVDCEPDFCIKNVALIKPRKVAPTYLIRLINAPVFQKYLADNLDGGIQKFISLGKLRQLSIPLPDEAEQRAIATALSDVDGLLGGLDRLIAKKRDLKQAAMQQLLTGQTRLPGFHGEWEVKRLEQVAEISTGINKPLSEMGRGALYVTVQDLYDKTSIRTERLSRIKVSLSEIETRGLMVGDIVFGKSSVKRDGIGYPSQFLGCDEPVVFSGFTYRARARQGITDAAFLFYALREEKTRRWLIDNSQASALTNINQTIADAIPIQVPPSIPEQTAIATVLSEMDGELAVLEQGREKTRALKQAMMQELLTGRTRLI
jgi:type I restriction enzyme S subunit